MPILLASIHGDDDDDCLFEVCQNSSCRLCLWCRIVDKIITGVANALKIYCSSSDLIFALFTAPSVMLHNPMFITTGLHNPRFIPTGLLKKFNLLILCAWPHASVCTGNMQFPVHFGSSTHAMSWSSVPPPESAQICNHSNSVLNWMPLL